MDHRLGMRMLYQSGITKVIVKEKYKDYSQLKIMGDIKIVESVSPEGFTIITYHPHGE